MPSSLNTTFNATKDKFSANKPQENQSGDSPSCAKYHSNELGKEIASYSTLTSNHSHILKEEIELKKSLTGLHSLSKTEEKPLPINLQYVVRRKRNVNDKEEEPFKFSTPIYENTSKYVLRKESLQNKNDFLYAKQDSFEIDDFMASPKISSSVLPNLTSTHSRISMNFVMLVGFLAGLLLSKLLSQLEVVLLLLLEKILQARNYLMDTTSIWKFLNLDYTKRSQVKRSKLVLLPIVLICCFIYNLIGVLHFIVRLLLTTMPNNLIQLVQNLHE